MQSMKVNLIPIALKGITLALQSEPLNITNHLNLISSGSFPCSNHMLTPPRSQSYAPHTWDTDAWRPRVEHSLSYILDIYSENQEWNPDHLSDLQHEILWELQTVIYIQDNDERQL